MSGLPRILMALTPLVERAVEHDLFGAEKTVDVVASAAEADELEELIGAHPADAVVVSPDLSGLRAAHCTQASAAGLRVVGLALDEVGGDLLTAVGVDTSLTPPLEDGALAAAARGPATAPAASRAPRRPPPRAKGTEGASVVAVIGSQGAPGASECAASLATLAHRHWDTVLVEVDALGPSLDVRLDADARRGSLAGLARAVQTEERDLDNLTARWVVSRPGWPPVLLGAPEPTHDLARPGAASRAIRALAQIRPLVICDVGFLIAADDPEGSSTIARIHRETIAVADAIVLVLGARDVQLRHGLGQVAELADGLDIASERLRVLVNGVGAPGASSRLEIEAALLPRLAERGLGIDAWMPWDKRALTQASRRGLPLASVRARGGYRRSIAHLLDEMFLPTTPVARARTQRLAPTGPATPAPADRSGAEVAVPWRH